MKILVTSAASYNLNGITKFILNYYTHKNLGAIEVDFVSIQEIPENVEISLNKVAKKIHIIKNRSKNPIKYIIRLYKICKSEGYDIIHSHGNSYTLAFEMLAAKFAKIPIRIAHFHSTTTKFKIFNLCMKPIFFMTYNYAFTCSEIVGKKYFNNKEYTVVKNAFNLEKFTFDLKERDRLKSVFHLNDELVIGHIGTFQKVKNHDFIIDVFRIINEKTSAKLMLIGYGPEKKRIIEKVSQLKLGQDVIFLENRNDIDKLINVFDYFIFPSSYEGLGIVLLETQLNGISILTSDAISNEVILSKNIIQLSLEKGPKDWADSLLELPTDRVKNNLQILKEHGYDINDQTKKLMKIFQIFIDKTILGE